jgi:hypothetical protein
MRKVWLLIIVFILMNLVAILWKVTPMPQEDLIRFYDNRWAIRLAISVLCGIGGFLTAKGDD